MSVKPFLDDNFLLENKTAEILYHEYAAPQPIIDYHNHLPPAEVANDRRFDNVSQAWLYGDHYKWRAMRALGIDERYITGDASDEEKFLRWAEAVPSTLRNPLFHWTHLELQRYFGIDAILNSHSAQSIYQQTNEFLATKKGSARGLLRMMNVEVICTTDDPTDDLRYHEQMQAEGVSDLKMSMAFRPDAAILIERDTYNAYIDKLRAVADSDISTFEELIEALLSRMDYFHAHGCRLSDHGLNQISAESYTVDEVEAIFKRKIAGERLSANEMEQYKSAVLYRLGVAYAERGWVQQFHLGALRNNNDRMLRELGPDTGFDSIGDFEQAVPLSRLLNRLDNENKLAKTILYNLNPRDNEVIATMIGNYNDGSIRGKMQFGSGWWFLDQKDGMEKQINALSNMGVLSCFIGMLTDSRSFLSFPRHEYFRRILCNLIGRDVHNGELPNDTKWLGQVVADISYYNAKNYFDF